MKRLTFILFLFSQALLAQVSYLLPNEQAIFSFETAKGKKVMLAKDKGNKYIIYRFGTKDKIELEYPEKDKSSWNKFAYAEYHRGGGKANSGMDIENIIFINKGFQYVIYNNYHAGDDTIPEGKNAGIAVLDPKTLKVLSDTEGIKKTVKGDWYDLKTEGLIKDGTEKYGLF